MMDRIVPIAAIIGGSVMIGVHFGSVMVSIGVYLCCVGITGVKK